MGLFGSDRADRAIRFPEGNRNRALRRPGPSKETVESSTRHRNQGNASNGLGMPSRGRELSLLPVLFSWSTRLNEYVKRGYRNRVADQHIFVVEDDISEGIRPAISLQKDVR